MDFKFQVSGFKDVPNVETLESGFTQLLKRQNLLVNRVICVLELKKNPDNLGHYLKTIRKKAAFKVGFFPFFYGLGLQVVLSCPGISKMRYNPKKFVATIDNQWAIIQSLFLVDPQAKTFVGGATWGQVISGKYQKEIWNQLAQTYKNELYT